MRVIQPRAGRVNFTHSAAEFPGRHNGSVTCEDCHTGNTQAATWTSPAYKPDCAGCHANDYESDPHKKHENPDVRYTVSELRNCSGACHVYTNSSLTTIKELRNSNHRSTDGGWD